MKKKDFCPICKSKEIKQVLVRRSVPVYQCFLLEDYDRAIEVECGDLDLYSCASCCFLFNSSFDVNKLDYSLKYNTQPFSAFFNNYLMDLAMDIIEKGNISGKNVLEIGCGQGDFLKLLVRLGKDIQGFGFDPNYRGGDNEKDCPNITFFRDLYRPLYTHIKADVVICRHVIEHIEDPIRLLRIIRKTLEHSSEPKIYFETPCAEWILKNHAIWDFFYEHCSYFTSTSLRKAFEIAGFEIKKIKHIFEGQFLWLEAGIKNVSEKFEENIEQYRKIETDVIRNVQSRLQYYFKNGNIALCGAGGKGVTFCNLFDLQRKWLSCVVDINPNKQGMYIPQTGHPIIGYSELSNWNIKTLILLNSNYLNENIQQLEMHRLDIHIVDMQSTLFHK